MMPSRPRRTRRGCRTAPLPRRRATVRRSRSAMPSTPFIGVRISWLIVARNWDLARLAASACSRARTSSACARLRSVMSRRTAVKNTSSPMRISLSASSSGNRCHPCGPPSAHVRVMIALVVLRRPNSPMSRTFRTGHQCRDVRVGDLVRRVAEDPLRAGAPLPDVTVV